MKLRVEKFVYFMGSTPSKLLKNMVEPPEYLYHGTTPEMISSILKGGLLPMRRHCVHLSLDIDC